jgi:hypothetical protein
MGLCELVYDVWKGGLLLFDELVVCRNGVWCV